MEEASAKAEMQWAIEQMRISGIDTARLDAELLLGHVAGLSRTQLIARTDTRLSKPQREHFRDLVARRVDRYPLPYLLGEWEFWGMKLEVNSSVLIPRPETEVLVEACIEWLRGGKVSVGEVGVGSGAISIALAKELPEAVVYATDISPEAAATAVRNVERFGLQDRIRVLPGDLVRPMYDKRLRGRLDALVSNPPYVRADAANDLQPEVLNEPLLATVAGDDPLLFYRRILTEGRGLLREGARVFFEIDPGLAEPITGLARERGYEFIEMRRDLAGLERVVIVECVS